MRTGMRGALEPHSVRTEMRGALEPSSVLSLMLLESGARALSNSCFAWLGPRLDLRVGVLHIRRERERER